MERNLKNESLQNIRSMQHKCLLYTTLMKSTQTNQFLYKYQLKHQHPDISKAEEKWSAEFNKQDINWEKLYKISIQLPYTVN